MNFFGHAAVAAQFSELPAYLLGAMLPDFCAMLRVRTPAVEPGTLADGVRCHHATDHVFHELPRFRRWCADASAELARAGVARGTSRAVAHVGLEFLLDAALAENEGSRVAYAGGLGAGSDPTVLGALAWADAEKLRLERLTRTLAERAVVTKVSVEVVVERLERTLSGRARLAIAPHDKVPVANWVERIQPDVVASAPALVAELTRELARRLAA